MLKIGIIGTRGIPNHYGGFEQLAQYLSAGLVEKGCEVSVYNSHKHPYQKDNWKGVNIIHCYDPEYIIGTSGQFIYDLNCTLDVRKRNFDVLLILGYTSSSVWGWLYPKETVCINHMDGLEWKREKYGPLTKRFLLYAEKLAIRFSSYFISDALPIQSYIKEKYRVESEYISYGAEIIYKPQKYDTLVKDPFYLLIARMEKENNIEMILDGMQASNSPNRFIVVGSTGNHFGKYLQNKYRNNQQIQFVGAVYDQSKTAELKRNCQLYFHGHSVGGTNPSLIEAMAAGAIICAHENVYNRAVLEEDGRYFTNSGDVASILADTSLNIQRENISTANLLKIRTMYNWPSITNRYYKFILSCYNHQHP